MTIKLQSRSIFVSYIQEYLRNYFGMTLIETDTDEGYEISQSRPIRVTGRYTQQTYLSVSLFMLYNYPNEQFPLRWDIEDPASHRVSWITTPFDSATLKQTMNLLISQDAGKNTTFSKDDYEEIIKSTQNPEQYFSWSTLLKYYFDEDDLRKLLGTKSQSDEMTQSDVNHSLIVFLVNNVEQSEINDDIFTLNERILSYFIGEVVTESSTPDEILRVQKIMYPEGVEYQRSGVFDEKMKQEVLDVQRKFIETYTVTTLEGTQIITLPEGYDGFRVTGYIDPWTEVILKGGVE